VPTPAARKQVVEVGSPAAIRREQGPVYILPDHNFARQADMDNTRYEPITVDVQVIFFLQIIDYFKGGGPLLFFVKSRASTSVGWLRLRSPYLLETSLIP
jgi:hypothetical protein